MGEILGGNDYSQPVINDSFGIGEKLANSNSEVADSQEIITEQDKLRELGKEFVDDSSEINNTQSLENFLLYFSGLENDSKNQIMDVFSSPEGNRKYKLFDFVYDNGFPNIKNQDFFSSTFGLGVDFTQIIESSEQREEKDKIAEEKDKIAEEKDKIAGKMIKQNESIEVEKLISKHEKYKGIYTDLEGYNSGVIGDFNKKLKLVSEFKINSINDPNKKVELQDYIDDVVKYLDKKDVLDKILSALSDIDKQNGYVGDPSEGPLFRLISNKISLINPSFGEKVNSWKNENDLLKKAVISGLLPSENLKKDGLKYISTTDNGDKVIVDTSTIAPTRYLQLSNSNYSLKTDVSVLDYTPIVTKYETIRQDVEPKYNSVNLALDYIYNNSDLNIGTLKNVLKSDKGLGHELYNELGIESIDSVEAVKDLLETKRSEYKDQLIEAYDDYNSGLDGLIGVYRDRMKENDKSSLETLDFLNSIGFDLIDQSVTDQIIKDINNGNQLSSLGFKSKIDLQNGDLGINLDGDLTKMSYNEKKVFVEFVNKMITGNKKIPNKLTSSGEMQFYESEEDLKDGKTSDLVDKKAYINGKLGISPIIKIRENLSLQQTEK